MKKYESRSEVEEQYKWDLSTFIKDEDEFNESIKFVKENLPKIDEYIGCTKDAKKLYEYICFDVSLGACLEKMDAYTFAKRDEDLANQEEAKKRLDVGNLINEYNYKTSFFIPEVLNLSNEEYNALFEYEELKKYKAYLDDIYRNKEHKLEEKEEQIVALMSKNIKNYSTLSSTILNSSNDYGSVNIDGEVITLTTTNYAQLLRKSDREKRKEIYLQFNKVIRQYANVLAMNLNYYVNENVSLAKIYHFKSAWDKKLFYLKLNDKVFTSLTNVVYKYNHVNEKLANLRKKVFELDELMPWDSALELAKNTREYEIEEVRDILVSALKPLGNDYIKHLEHVFDSRSIDYAQYKGKRSGAYSLSAFCCHDPKILMSFNGEFSDISTIAHESGHHVNHQYKFENNLDLYSQTSPMVGEVTSLTNEFLLSYYMLNSNDKNDQLVGLANIIELIDANIIGAVLEGNIERKMYDVVENGGSLTSDVLDSLSEKEYKNMFGDKPLKHEYVKNMWCRRNHFYMNFYLFSYAISASVALYVTKNIIDGNKEVLDKYMDFLKIGNDVDIIDAYKVLGIDIEDEKVYIEAMKFYDSLLDKFIEVKES